MYFQSKICLNKSKNKPEGRLEGEEGRKGVVAFSTKAQGQLRETEPALSVLEERAF